MTREKLPPVQLWDIHVSEMVPSGRQESPSAVTSLLSRPDACSRQKGSWEEDLLVTPPHPPLLLSRAGEG